MSRRGLSIRRVGLCVLAASIAGACASQSNKQSTLEKQANVDSGARLYRSLCASCHGAEAKGNGPVASLLVTPPPDLTKISERRKGHYVASEIRAIIDGRETRTAHGPRDMPVWGRQLYFSAFRDDATARAEADARIEWLVDYLETLQTFGK